MVLTKNLPLIGRRFALSILSPWQVPNISDSFRNPGGDFRIQGTIGARITQSMMAPLSLLALSLTPRLSIRVGCLLACGLTGLTSTLVAEEARKDLLWDLPAGVKSLEVRGCSAHRCQASGVIEAELPKTDLASHPRYRKSC